MIRDMYRIRREPRLLHRKSGSEIVQCGEPSAKGPVACSIRVSTRAFVRIERIVRKRESVKFFVFNNRQGFESHPLRQPIDLCFQLVS